MNEHTFRRATLLALGIALLSPTLPALAATAMAQRARPAIERVHPERVDSTWGSRVHAAWALTTSEQWQPAERAFDTLHREQPDAVEPLVGLGVVARGKREPAAARGWFRHALDVEPESRDAQTLLAAVEWDRPGRIELSSGYATIGAGGSSTEFGGTMLWPVAEPLSITARAATIGAGDVLRAIDIGGTGTSASSTRANVIGVGAVARLNRVTIVPRLEQWTTGSRHETFAWVDGAVAVAPSFSATLGYRPLDGTLHAARVSAGAEFSVASGNATSVQIVRALTPSPAEARLQLIAFHSVTTGSTNNATYRAGIVRDSDPLLSATTGVASVEYLVTSRMGGRVEVAVRRGAFARSSVAVALIRRW
ncbi:MAG: hypothetical protein ABJF01_12850 [bacterium]